MPETKIRCFKIVTLGKPLKIKFEFEHEIEPVFKLGIEPEFKLKIQLKFQFQIKFKFQSEIELELNLRLGKLLTENSNLIHHR